MLVLNLVPIVQLVVSDLRLLDAIRGAFTETGKNWLEQEILGCLPGGGKGVLETQDLISDFFVVFGEVFPPFT